MQKLKISFILLISISVLFFSCKKDKYDFSNLQGTQWSPNIALPLIHSELTLEDMITEDAATYFIPDAEGFLTIYYKSSVFSINAEDLFSISIEDTTLKFGLTTQQIDTLLLGEITINVSNTFTLNMPLDDAGNPIQVDTMRLDAGSFSLTLTNKLENPSTITFTIPSIKDPAGQPLIDSFQFQYPSTQGKTYNVAGCTFDLTNGGTTSNTLAIDYVVHIVNAGGSISPDDSIEITVSLDNLDFDLLTGYLGQYNIELDTGNINIGLNKNNIEGDIVFADPKLNLYLCSYFGLPFKAHFDLLRAYSSADSLDVTLLANPTLDFTLNKPAQIGDSTTLSIIFNRFTSNIVDIMAMPPQTLKYDVMGLSNPAGPPYHNFILDTSRFSVDVEFELPLYGKISNFVLRDTVEFDFENSVGSIDELQYVTFKFIMENGFPLDVGGQIYFTDTAYIRLDSLFNTAYYLLVASASVDANGKVTNPTKTETEVTIDKIRLTNLKDTKKLIITARLSTTNQGGTDVKIYSYYTIDVKLGIRAQFEVHVE